MKISKIAGLIGGVLLCAAILFIISGPYPQASPLLMLALVFTMLSGPHLDEDIAKIKDWIRRKVKK